MSRRPRIRIGSALLIGLSLMPAGARAGWYYPRGYGGYGWGGFGSGMGATDPAAGYMAGLGSFARGQGVYEVEDAKARAINLDTMTKWNKELRARQQQLKQEKAREDAQRRAQRDARVERMELEDGTTINNLLMQILDFDPNATRSTRAGAPIGASAVHEIPFQWNTEAITVCLDQLTARDALPTDLTDDSYTKWRTAVSNAVDLALEQDQRGDVPPETIARLNTAIADFHKEFLRRESKDDPDYDDGETYFATLASLSRLLNDPSMKKVLAELQSDRETTLGHLIGFMQAYNLRFGPATTARQVQIYQTLISLFQQVRDDLNGAPGSSQPASQPPPPPAPGITGKDGKGLQDAARQAFGKMSWPQLDAHGHEP
jgi:hypothetical protein